MILTEGEYLAALSYCRELVQNFSPPDGKKCFELGIDYDIANSISNQLFVRRLKKMSHIVEADIENIQKVGQLINV
jgi:hypothetical protein